MMQFTFLSYIHVLSSLLFRFILHIMMMHFIMQNNRNNNKNNHNEHGFYAKCQFHMRYCYSTSWSILMSLTKTNKFQPRVRKYKQHHRLILFFSNRPIMIPNVPWVIMSLHLSSFLCFVPSSQFWPLLMELMAGSALRPKGLKDHHNLNEEL